MAAVRAILRWTWGIWVVRCSLIVLAAGLAVLWGMMGLIDSLRWLLQPLVYKKDFINIYLLGKAFAASGDPYSPMNALAARFIGSTRGVRIFAHPTPHPPTMGLIAMPLGALRYELAAALWFCLSLAALLASLHLLQKLTGFRPWKGILALLPFVALSYPPVGQDLSLGQPTMFLLLLLTGALVSLRSGHQGRAGLLVGISLLIKQLAWPLVLLFLMRRQWRAFWASSATMAVGYALAVLRTGPSGLWRYVTRVLPEVGAIYRSSTFNTSPFAIPYVRVLARNIGSVTFPSGPPTPQQTAIGSGLCLALLLGSVLAIRKRPDTEAAYCVMIVVSTVINPVSWQFYQVLILIPAFYIFGWLRDRGYPWRESVAAVLVGLALYQPYNQWEKFAFWAAGRVPPSDGGKNLASLDYLPGLITFGLLYSAIALITLLAWLNRPPDLQRAIERG